MRIRQKAHDQATNAHVHTEGRSGLGDVTGMNLAVTLEHPPTQRLGAFPVVHVGDEQPIGVIVIEALEDALRETLRIDVRRCP